MARRRGRDRRHQRGRSALRRALCRVWHEAGWAAPKLWLNHLCFNDIEKGDNGAFRARIGPDPCTGLGSPIGTRLAALLARPRADGRRPASDLEAENHRLRAIIARLGGTRRLDATVRG